MKNIIKYQLLDRWQTYKILGGVMIALNVATMLVILLLPEMGTRDSALNGSFWIVLSYMVTVILPMVIFFMASCGHIYELLYRNTGYLVLSVPRTGAEILGGRMIAGLVEFLAYAVPSFLLLYLNTSIIAFKQNHSLLKNGELFLSFNFLELLKVAGVGIVYFAIIGSVISFAAIASASIIKKRNVAKILSFFAAIFILGQIASLGEWLYRRFDFLGSFSINSDIIRIAGINSNAPLSSMAVPIAPMLLLLIVAAGLFWVSSFLLEKKVEV